MEKIKPTPVAGVPVISNILAEDRSQHQENLLQSTADLQETNLSTQPTTKPNLNVFINIFSRGPAISANFWKFLSKLSQNLKFSLKTVSPSQSYAKNDGKSRKIKTGQQVHHTLLRQLSHPARVCLQHEGKTILNVVKPESASSLRLSH